MRVIHVLRKPLSEKTVAANVLEHGTGAINVDASRIASPGETITNHSRGDDSAVSKGIYGDSKGQETHQTAGQKRGRWPGNIILEHDEECRCLGTKRVKGVTGGANPIRRGGVHTKAGGHQTVGRVQEYSDHADGDGMETVGAWDCVEDCPVRALDVQSIAGGMHGAGRARSKVVEGGVEATSINMGGARDMFRLGDKGGASRFFKQVGGDD